MLDARANRLDYGEQLIPPEGFELDVAVATSYSLDLNALLAVPVALCFRNTLEGDLRGEKLALYEALNQLQGKLKVFYQQGQVQVPSEYNRLFAMLEPCLQPVVPPDRAFSAFHPKVWLLRFIKRGDCARRSGVCYRMLVLSRNLTFDRSWDLALSLDGELRRGKGQPAPWQRFFTDLLEQTPDFAGASTIQDEMPRIQWHVPEPFYDLELFPGGPAYGSPLESAGADLDSLMVVSPFIRSQSGGISALKRLGLDGEPGAKIMCSRAEELDAIGADALSDWTCYAINTNVVQGEEGLEEPNAGLGSGHERRLQDLHAKLVVRESEAGYHWYLGSANATSAALGDGQQPPRNQEFMARLDGVDDSLSPQALLEQWLARGLFLPHEFSTITDDEDAELQVQLRQLTYALVSADWQMRAEPNDEGSYSVSLVHDLDPASLPAAVRVRASLLASPGPVDLAEQMHWSRVPLEQLTCFVLIDIEVCTPCSSGTEGADTVRDRLLVNANLDIAGGDMRPRALMQSLVDTPERLLQYVRLLLQAQPDKSQWLGMETAYAGTGMGLADVLDLGEPLFEQLMLAASRHPEVVRRVDDLVRRLRATDIALPPAFAELWQHFAPESS